MLTKHFSLEELTITSHKEIKNEPTETIKHNLMMLANALEMIRDLIKHPILISSGYRCPELNEKIGGSKNSRHMLGLAADFTSPLFGSPRAVCHAIMDSDIPFDQLIYERPDPSKTGWCHFGLPIPGDGYRMEALTLSSPGTYIRGIA